jgi:hypothetical protein
MLFFMHILQGDLRCAFSVITRAKHILISFPLPQAGIRLTLL